MIQIKFMKPFYTKTSGINMRMVFAYNYISIIKDDEVFHFIPIEGKEIIVNLETKQVENLSEVFVFQRGNRFIRLPLYQLMLISNVDEYIMPIIDGEVLSNPTDIENEEDVDADFHKEVKNVIEQLESVNLINYINYNIDKALENNDKEAFIKFSNELNNLLTKA